MAAMAQYPAIEGEAAAVGRPRPLQPGPFSHGFNALHSPRRSPPAAAGGRDGGAQGHRWQSQGGGHTWSTRARTPAADAPGIGPQS